MMTSGELPVQLLPDDLRNHRNHAGTPHRPPRRSRLARTRSRQSPSALPVHRWLENRRFEAPSGGSTPETRPTDALVSEEATQVSNHATVASAPAVENRLLGPPGDPPGSTSFSTRPPSLTTTTAPVRRAVTAFLFRRAMDNLFAAAGTVSPVRAAAPAEDPRSGLTR